METYLYKTLNVSGHPRLEPRHFVEPDIVESYSKQYMFLGSIEFISKVCIHIYNIHTHIDDFIRFFYTLIKITSGKDWSIF